MGLGGLAEDVVGDADEQSLALGQHGAIIESDLAPAFEGAVAAPGQPGATGEALADGGGAAIADLESAGHRPGACEERRATPGLVEGGGGQPAGGDARG